MTLLAACCRRPGVRTVCVSLVTLITLGLLCAAPRSFLADHDARAHATHANAHAGPAFGARGSRRRGRVCARSAPLQPSPGGAMRSARNPCRLLRLRCCTPSCLTLPPAYWRTDARGA